LSGRELARTVKLNYGTNKIKMKAKLAIVTLIGLTAATLALAQNEPAATPAAETAPPAAAPPTPDVAPAPAAAPAAVAAPVADATIPLIQFQDVPLTTAIDNLARQASINYILDPKVGYGQPDERGQLKSQPNISIRWENLTAAQALGALITTYGLQLVDDPKTKISRVTVKDPAAAEPLQTRIIQLKYAAPSNVLASVQTTFYDKRSKVVADTRTSQLVLSATEKELDNAEKLVTRLDTPTKQVLIEAKLVETSMNPSTVKGIDWSGTLKAQNFRFGNNVDGGQGGRYSQTVSSNAVGGLVDVFGPNNLLNNPSLLIDTAKGFNPATAFLDADGLSATLGFLNENSDAKVIATPRAVTLDNETADLSVTRATPIFKNTAGTQGSPGGSEVTYTNLGVLLKVTPRISANNSVNLHVCPEVSRVFTTITKTVASTVNQADVYDIRKIDTQVMIPSGNTLVLGGLVSDSTTKKNVKVPLLGDLPFIGLAFRQDSKARDQSNLIIFITPTIVKDEDFQPAQSDYMKTKPTDIDDTKWNAWDSGKPMDWSKASTMGTKD
jgi:type II secretory pathway component GspD/PulD (secretin)